MAWLFHTVSILTKVAGTLSLRMATRGRRHWYAAVVAGYLVEFTCLSLAPVEGMALRLPTASGRPPGWRSRHWRAGCCSTRR
ncbi:MAG: multidrug efflux transporter [Citricoccus sp.]|jgi:multidrug transporter EmrE-like cation transporter|nr:multidrug efflux transporter [Citricoccus sp. WCRC_4]